MIPVLQQMNRLANRHAGKGLLVGLAAVGGYNWWLWRRERAEAARLRDHPSPMPAFAHTPKVSALVAAWNECHRIEDHIRSFLALSYPNIELVLCAGGPDGTLEIARRYASERIMVIEQQPGEGKQRSLARCLEYATGEIIYLIDADCIYEQEALIRLLAPLIEDGMHVSTGSIRPLDEQLDRLLPRYLWSSDAVVNVRSPTSSKGLRGANAAVTRRALDQIGGLNFAARTGTDYQLALRLLEAGFDIRLVPESIVATEYAEDIGLYRRRQSRWLRNLIIYGWQQGALHDVSVTLKTVAVGALMLLLPLLALLLGPAIAVAWLLVFSHAVCSKLRYLLFSSLLYRLSVPLRLVPGLVPLTLMDFVIWASPITDLLHAARRKQW